MSNGNQRNQSKLTAPLRTSASPPLPKIKIESHPYDLDLIMHNDVTLGFCCDMKDFELVIKSEVQEWLDENDISVKFSVYFGIFYFKTDEERVKFILKWL